MVRLLNKKHYYYTLRKISVRRFSFLDEIFIGKTLPCPFWNSALNKRDSILSGRAEKRFWSHKT